MRNISVCIMYVVSSHTDSVANSMGAFMEDFMKFGPLFCPATTSFLITQEKKLGEDNKAFVLCPSKAP